MANLDAQIRKLIEDIANRLDSCLDANDGDVLTRIAVMECRNALQKYGGLWDVPRCRKAIEKFIAELQATGFPDDLLKPVAATCKRVSKALRAI
jgi:hypothetical protein